MMVLLLSPFYRGGIERSGTLLRVTTDKWWCQDLSSGILTPGAE